MEALISSRVSVGELAPPPTMELPPPSSSPRKYSLPPASTDRCTRNRSSSTTTVTSQNWPHRYCETIAAGSAVPPSRMAVGDGTAAGSVRARFEGRFDMAEDDRRRRRCSTDRTRAQDQTCAVVVETGSANWNPKTAV